MNTWPYTVTSLQWSEIEEAVKDFRWQEFRKTLKGISTVAKLGRLDLYVISARRANGGEMPRVEQVRIDNYINALLRGGQLIRRGNEIHIQR